MWIVPIDHSLLEEYFYVHICMGRERRHHVSRLSLPNVLLLTSVATAGTVVATFFSAEIQQSLEHFFSGDTTAESASTIVPLEPIKASASLPPLDPAVMQQIENVSIDQEKINVQQGEIRAVADSRGQSACIDQLMNDVDRLQADIDAQTEQFSREVAAGGVTAEERARFGASLQNRMQQVDYMLFQARKIINGGAFCA